MMKFTCFLHLKTFLSFFLSFFRLLQPICLGGFVNYFAQTKEEPMSEGEAYAYASGIVFSTAFMMCSFHPFLYYALNISCRTRVACSGLIYRKALRILKSSTKEGQNGKIINILSNGIFNTNTINVNL